MAIILQLDEKLQRHIHLKRSKLYPKKKKQNPHFLAGIWFGCIHNEFFFLLFFGGKG